MEVLDILREDRVVAVVRAPRVADPAGLAETLVTAGIRCMELTFTIPDVLPAIEAASASKAVVGAGTVIRPEQAKAAVEAGARFIVSPVLAPSLVEAAGGLPVILGAFTPTEVLAAVEAAAAAVKIFPARVGGPAYLRDLLAPLPGTPLIPSGGIDESNARAFLEAGAVAVYAGSSLVPARAAATGDHDEIARRAAALVASLG
ncbi:MAG: bifunctional 4-hydroxy-2-oxoglutarate aldolase/2-dehydro-3-deoxy-phosphogluconate aldolase [Acidimicrobiia bacterium]